MTNLEIYKKARAVPAEAQKTIAAGRLKGMTDINPMWRIKMLTELFGPCGTGWYYQITNKWLEKSDQTNEVTANVEISLFYKIDNEWSMPIEGIGGSKFVAAEKNGLYTDDECYKKALTDAISVACKALGIGADVYWSKDRTKYTAYEPSDNMASDLEKKTLKDRCRQLNVSLVAVLRQAGMTDDEIRAGLLTSEYHGRALIILKEIEDAKNEQNESGV